MKKAKFFLRNVFVLIFYFIGFTFLISGFIHLTTDECKELKKVLNEKSLTGKEVEIKTFLNKNYQCRIKNTKCENHISYLNVCNKEIKLDNITEINGINVYKIVSEKIYKKAIKGIIFVATGGFILILITVFKDFI